MTDEVEAVARALCASNQDVWTNGPTDWAYLDDARAAIAALDKARDGWKLVPVNPNNAMLDAARDWSGKKYGKPVGNDGANGCWSAMLAAAPSPETEA